MVRRKPLADARGTVARIEAQIAQIYTDIVKTTKTTGTTAGNGSRERTAYNSKQKPPLNYGTAAENGLPIATNQPRRAAVIQQQTERAGEG